MAQCLDSAASGAAIAAALAEGEAVPGLDEIATRARSGDRAAATALRQAGTVIGDVLATIVNFFNPSDVVLAGELSTSEIMVSAIRAELFRRCLQVATHELTIRASSDPVKAELHGAVLAAQDRALQPAQLQARLRF